MPVKQKPVGRHMKSKWPGVYLSRSASGRETWEAKYKDSSGKWTYDPCGSREEAMSRAKQMSARVDRGEVVNGKVVTLADVLPAWREWRKVDTRTVDSYESNVRLRIEPRFGKTRVRDITRADLRSWWNTMKRLDGREGEVAEGTKALALAVLSSILDYCVEAGIVGTNVSKTFVRGVKPSKVKSQDDFRILDADELSRLLGYCEGFDWLRPIILTTVYGALRLGEVLGLDWRHVDFDNGVLIIEQQMTKAGTIKHSTKGKRAETVPMSRQMRKVLAEHKLASAKTGDHDAVFVNRSGGRRIQKDTQRAFGWARERAGLSVAPRPVRFHDLRHTGISYAVNVPGVKIKQVQRFARHAQAATTETYMHPVADPTWTDDLGDAFEALG